MLLDKIKQLKLEDFDIIDIDRVTAESKHEGMITNILHKPSQEHYRLLCLLSTWFNNEVIYELGTYQGASSLCLAYNKTNRVITYDIEYNLEVNIQHNVEYRLGDYKNDKNLLNSPLIFIDTIHDGEFELDFYNYLIENNYKGLTIWDDIHLTEGMKKFWNLVTRPKYDITNFGHSSGTGAIIFQ